MSRTELQGSPGGHPTYVPTAPFPGGLRALEASAGTGKTYSVTSTILRLVVEDPELTMDALLVVTFTKAATAELVDRTRARLLEGLTALRTGDAAGDPVLTHVLAWADDHDGRDAVVARVERAVQQVDEAMISTIHGFCQRVLQQAAFASLVDPGLEVETEQDRLVHQVVDDWAIALQHDASPAFLSALDTVKLSPTLMRTIGRAVADEPALHVVPALVEGDPRRLVDDAFGVLARAVEHGGEQLAAASEAVMALPVAEGGGRGSMWKRATVEERFAEVQQAVDAGVLPGDNAWRRLRSDADTTSAGVSMPAPLAETDVVRAMDGLAATLDRVEVMVRTQLAAHVAEEVARRRQQAGTASFADLLRDLDRALARDVEGRLVSEVRAGYRAVLVDEFQDTDPVQWRILHTLFGDGRHLDVVGDPKQAIYGFRGADLATYQRAVGAAVEVRTMRTNWRSDGPYVDACNALMDQPGVFGLDGSVPYVPVAAAPEHREARLRDAAGEPASGVVLSFHRRVDGAVEPMTKGELEARVADVTAEQVVTTMGDGSTIDGRPVTARDCAVLVRAGYHAELVAAALRRRGVPVVVGGGRDVLATPQAAEVADLLAALLAPGDERRLRRVLAGPFGGLDAVAITRLDDEGWGRWYRLAARWARAWERQGVAAAIQGAIRDSGAELRLAGQREGERVLTNLRHLGELLHRVEQDESLGAHALAAWLAAQREGSAGRPAEERELRLERDDDAVRVMTIHTSKGLEFPLVWLPFSWGSDVRPERSDTRVKPFSVNDPDDPVVPDRRVLALYAAASDDAAADPERRRLVHHKDRADWESGHRLLYVALTRAAHRTTVHLAGVKDLEQSSLWHLLLRADHELGGPDGTAAVPADLALIETLERHAAHDAITLELVGPGRGPRTRMARRAGDDDLLAARRYERLEPLDVHWGRASYSRLVDGRTAPPVEESEPADARDHDAVASSGKPTTELVDPPLTGEPVPLQDLPRGADWGTFVHDVLEHADFAADAAQLRALIADRARRGPLTVTDEQQAILTDGLLATLATPLGPMLDGLRLRDVGRKDRIDELGFALGLGGRDDRFTLLRVADVFEQHAANADVPLAAAAAHLRAGGAGEAVHGLLIGFVDLVLRAPDGRAWIVDYKTNGLGVTLDEDDDAGGTRRRYVEEVAHQHPDRVMASMIDHDYLVQAHLYVVAVQRYLRARLGDAYAYDTHIGGWAYLYLRGLTGAGSAVTEDGRPHGVAAGRPTRALVDALDAALGGLA